jgi:hypothetical protein
MEEKRLRGDSGKVSGKNLEKTLTFLFVDRGPTV